MSASSGRLQLFHTLERLKTQKRTGWVREQLERPESIADHMYRMAVLALLSEDIQLDIAKCVLLAVVHDLAEAEAGDITPFDGISRDEKQNLEAKAMDHMLRELLPADSHASKRIMALWQEYEDATTPEARFVKDLDRVEMALQAVEYERDQTRILQPFLEASVPKIQHAEVRGWADDLMAERDELWRKRDRLSEIRPVSTISPKSQGRSQRSLIIVMGVSGSGKSTIGRGIANELKATFIDGDDLHSPEHVKKMANGQPLTDEDRLPWLHKIRETASQVLGEASHQSLVCIACSALKQSYRDILRGSADEHPIDLKTYFVYCKGSQALLQERISKREGHFMHAHMLQSQLDTLEEPSANEDETHGVVIVDIDQSPEAITTAAVSQIVALLDLKQSL
ncbi:uncharacterized protein L969DRAFT_84939 [Mixia osmundae IAM 14324]|uniref:Gluconokinase n=1 Tax=Mixia osmundae (strain CBS 9802 / IAM 14324 / JCM 22182 / KY 12970) TaxID=764103 RepID=G7DXL0_MIXOS|nr:uncharacterized protein L969DRAFT_84939 [Mixia osmundae IAM 14324]KEI41186.1 hypothetical protein L969DRAFT_84939 [Mixia osmundae IAM 14324]GAA95320.1 hypothetical protein E5Q_01977 [Mixia osmundae IAM 14324]